MVDFCFLSSLINSLFSFSCSLCTFNKFLPFGALKIKRFQASTHPKLVIWNLTWCSIFSSQKWVGGSATSKMWWPNKEFFEYNEELSVKRRSFPFNTHLSIYGSFLYHHPLVTPRISMLNPDQQLCEDKRAWKKFRQEAEIPLQALSWVYLGGWECDHLACVALAA